MKKRQMITKKREEKGRLKWESRANNRSEKIIKKQETEIGGIKHKIYDEEKAKERVKNEKKWKIKQKPDRRKRTWETK